MRAEHSCELFTAANIMARKCRTPTPVFHLSTQSADSAPASWGGEGVSVALYTQAFTPATTTGTASASVEHTRPSNGEDVIVDIEAGAMSANVPANVEGSMANGVSSNRV